MDRTAVINAVAAAIGAKRYLEIGVYVPERNYDRIEVDKKTGVDPSVGDKARGIQKKSSDEFFAKLAKNRRFDLIFIDGSHMYDQVKRDVDNAIGVLAVGGVILMHDVNPETILKAAPVKPSYGAAWSGECWKVFVEIASSSGFTGAVVPEDHGTGILVERPSAVRELTFPLTFEDLDANRQDYLNIIQSSPEAVKEFIGRA